MNIRKEYEITVQTQLQEWNAEIDKLKTKTGYSDAAPQTIATDKARGIKELQPRTSVDHKKAPQTIATSEHHGLEESISIDHKKAPQTIATSEHHGLEGSIPIDHKKAPQTIATSRRHHEHIDTLLSMHTLTKQKVDALREADDNNWENFKSEVEDALKKLGNEIKSIASRIH